MGTTIGESQEVERMSEQWRNNGRKELNSGLIDRYPCHKISNHIASELNVEGPNIMIPTACAAGNYAIGYGYDLIQNGDADWILAGGAESFSRIAFIGFSRLHAMSPDTCRPFDKNRKGILLGEGAGVLLLENLESAVKRRAKIFAEVLGYGLSCDAYHITAPHPEGKGAAEAMRRALKNARLTPEQVGYINAHGTGTLQNDRSETSAIKKVFDDKAYQIPMSSIKALTGHAMGAASAIEANACVLAIVRKVLPPTWNYEEPDPDCDLDYIPNEPREVAAGFSLRFVLNNSYAFGGNNSSVVFGKY
jgi:3-oxoacyl-[acyl-carrier-protein] synthase II